MSPNNALAFLLVALMATKTLAQTGYIDCFPGTLNIILAAPHGGELTPASIPDRTAGCWDVDTESCIWSHTCGTPDSNRCDATTATDLYTMELTNKIREELFALTGEYPTVVINLLDRSKLDANRDIDEATFGDPTAEEAWYEFHACIDNAKNAMIAAGERGLFFDIHGHGHSIDWAELGYLLSGSELDSGNSIDPATTSIRYLASIAGIPFEELLRGSESFGAYFEDEGYLAVPSPLNPGPDGNSYFSGGYNTERHGSLNGGIIDAIQIESARVHREDWNGNYGPAMARIMYRYLNRYGYPTRYGRKVST